MVGQNFRYIRADELFSGSGVRVRKTTIIEDVAREMQAERDLTIIDTDALRRGEDWSYLANKVVGAEGGNS